MATSDLIDAAVSRRARPVYQPVTQGQVFQPGGGFQTSTPVLPARSTQPPKAITPKFTVSAYVPPEAYANQPATGPAQPQPFSFAPAYSAARSTDDLVASAIQGRRAALDAQRSDIISRLNSLPARGKGSAQQAAALKAQLGSIESQDRSAAHDERSHAFQVAHQTTLDHKEERDIQSAQQHTALVQGLEQISSQHPPGTPEHAQAVLNLQSQIAQQYPLGKLPKEGVDLLKAHSAIHDDLATQTARAKAAGFDVTGFKTTKDGGVDINTKPTAQLASQAALQELKPYGLTPDHIQNPVSVRLGNLSYDNTGKAQFSGASDGAIARIDTGTKRGVVDLPIATYLKHGGQLSPTDQASQQKAGRVQPQPQSQPTVTGNEAPQLVHIDFRTPTGAFGHDLPANLHPDTVNAIASAYSTGDTDTGTRLAQAAMQPQAPQVAVAQPASAAPQQPGAPPVKHLGRYNPDTGQFE